MFLTGLLSKNGFRNMSHLALRSYTQKARQHPLVFKGTFIHSLSPEHLEVIKEGCIGVDSKGVISFVARGKDEILKIKEKFGLEEKDFVNLGKKILSPGFVDTHAHAPQYVFTGTGTDLPLLDWLNKYTFNFESKFKDPEYAQKVYPKAIRRHLKYGSTTTCYYGTIHLPSSKYLADVIAASGQRALVGKVNMDRNSPGHYCEETIQSIKDTEEFIEYVKTMPEYKEGIITPAITPRFVPSCTPTLMKALAQLAHKHELPIQSHISENISEVKWVQELHPECKSYSDVYYKHGLLTNRTIMGHCIYLNKEELDLFTDVGASVSHCALSNFTLNSGFMSIRGVYNSGTKMGLGTDVSGGPSSSMLVAIRHTLSASTVHSVMNDHDRIHWKEAYYLATLGGAKAIGIGDKVGNFIPGKEFDALVIDPYVPDSPFDVFEDSTTEIFEKFVFLGDDRNITQIYVKGKQIA